MGEGTDGYDISTSRFAVEHKGTDKDFMSLQVTWIVKIFNAAKFLGKDPLLVLTFNNADDSDRDWVLMPRHVAERYDLAIPQPQLELKSVARVRPDDLRKLTIVSERLHIPWVVAKLSTFIEAST